ncbi:MAG TPA: hypothetical protein VF627_13840 [Abditibacterium sp.]|jgi:hypothetical protein
MNLQNESGRKSTPPLDKWASDDDTISNYGHYGAILGAVLGFGLVLSSVLHCRIIRNSQGCGVDSAGAAIGAFAFMIVSIGVLGLLAGREVGKEHPSARVLVTVFYALFFFSQFAWSEVLDWLRPDLKETFWDETFDDWMLIASMIIYGLSRWLLKRKLESEQLNP